MTIRAAIYARVSSDRQARDGTIAAQLRDLPAYCERPTNRLAVWIAPGPRRRAA